MNKFQKHRIKKEKIPDNTPSFSVIFYNYQAEKTEPVRNTISRIHGDLKSKFRFYILSGNQVQAEEIADPDVKYLSPGRKLLPAEVEPSDLFVLLPMARLNSAVNLNDLIKGALPRLPEPKNFSRLLFENQPAMGTGCYILGKGLYNELTAVQGYTEQGFEKDLVWHMERVCLKPERSVISGTFPIDKPSSLLKNLKITGRPVKRWVEWNFGVLFTKEKFNLNHAGWQRMIFTLLSFLALVLIPIISFNAGISGDEEKHHLHAQKVYNYFKTDGADTLALNDPRYKLNYYSQSFDLLAFVIAEKFKIEKVYELRHVMNGFIGAMAIVTTAVFLRFLAGNFAGILALLFLGFSPRFLGHAMNNPLDIPFAFGYIFTLYQIFRFLRKLPDFSVSHSLWIMTGIAFTTSIRIGGMVLIPYFVMFAGLYVLVSPWPWKLFSKAFWKFTGKGSLFLVAISVAGYFISLLPWPYGLQNPIKNPFNALEMMANITVALRVMFEGNIIWSDFLPWYYIPKNMLLSIPVIILAGFLLPALMFLKKSQNHKGFWIFMLYFTVIFPIAYIIYKKSNVYGGWRHLIFVYPSFVILSAMGLNWLRESLSRKSIKLIFSILVIAAMIPPAVHIFRNYPLQYIYYNQLAGGVNKAFKKYETDYYLHSLKPGTDWIIENLKPETPGRKVRIISNAPSEIMKYYYRNDTDWISFPYTRYYDRGRYDWDYAIFYCNYIDPYHLKKQIWPPKNVIHEIRVDNVVVCVIVKRENKDDYFGNELLETGLKERNPYKIQEGIYKLEDAVAYDKYNEIAYLSLARAYIAIQQYDLARQRMNTLLSFYPNYDKALNLVGYSLLSEGEQKRDALMVDKSIAIFSQIIQINYKFVEAYHNLGLAYMMKGDDESALNYFEQAIQINARYKQSYYMVATIFEKRGDSERAMQIVEYANSL